MSSVLHLYGIAWTYVFVLWCANVLRGETVLPHLASVLSSHCLPVKVVAVAMFFWAAWGHGHARSHWIESLGGGMTNGCVVTSAVWAMFVPPVL